MSESLAESIASCCRLARRTGRNFYWSFLTLPRLMRRDMCVLYAFMRITDDLGDDDAASVDMRAELLERWRQNLRSVLRGEVLEGAPAGGDVLQATAELVERRGIPEQYLFDVIDGVETDLQPTRFECFGDLERYCYQVAGAVGLCCLHIWSFTDSPGVRQAAIDCGTAFQLTNILRDLAEDSDRGRVYLPHEDLDRFGYGPEEIRRRTRNPAFEQLMSFEVARARAYYDRAGHLFEHLSRPGQRILTAMFHIYGGLLDEIERRRYDVYSERVSLSRPRKAFVTLQSLACPIRMRPPPRGLPLQDVRE